MIGTGDSMWIALEEIDYLRAEMVRLRGEGESIVHSGRRTSEHELLAARETVIRAVLRVLTAERSEPHADSDAEAEYADEQLALAARDLAEATEQLSEDAKPVGWAR